jgi:NAD(P)-dependent dehydrogenase (short-subunit alcohol dehydrogenase family)
VRDPHELARLGVPLGQAGAAQDIANGVLFLASDVLRHMIGAELVIGPPEYDDGWDDGPFR